MSLEIVFRFRLKVIPCPRAGAQVPEGRNGRPRHREDVPDHHVPSRRQAGWGHTIR